MTCLSYEDRNSVVNCRQWCIKSAKIQIDGAYPNGYCNGKLCECEVVM